MEQLEDELKDMILNVYYGSTNRDATTRNFHDFATLFGFENIQRKGKLENAEWLTKRLQRAGFGKKLSKMVAWYILDYCKKQDAKPTELTASEIHSLGSACYVDSLELNQALSAMDQLTKHVARMVKQKEVEG